MDIASAAEILGGFALLLALAATPLFRLADGPPQGGAARVSSLDGLRGVLAFLVVFHHADLFRNAALGGWHATDRVLGHAGPIGVSVFFMITGTLFFGKLIAEDGRPRWGRLYVGRFFRIAPIYYVGVAGLLTLAALHTGFRLRVPGWTLAGEVGAWLLLGAQPVKIPVNGFGLAFLALAGATWSLRFEWAFYASLPAVAWLARLPRRTLPAVLGALLLAALASARLAPERIFPPSVPCAVSLFLVGMLCASLARATFRIPAVPETVSTVATVACLAALMRVHDIYTPLAVVILAVPFFLVTQGATMSGLLVSRAARRLGDVSYPVYLLHGLVLTAITHVPAIDRAFTGSTLGFLAITAAASAVILLLATLAHVAVERPGIALGRRLVAFLDDATGYAGGASRRSWLSSAGNARIQISTTARVPRPPITTAGTVPNQLAVSPDSNSPSSFELPMKMK